MAENDREKLIALALAEDLGDGDVTAAFFTAADALALARIVAREPGVAAGLAVAREVFLAVDPALDLSAGVSDGDRVECGDVVLEISGPTRSILSAERTALNFLQRLSAVATMARRYVDAVAGSGAVILDTRKTTPGWRQLEKAAVRAGGARNHRMGLYDRVMVKDNHLAAEDGAQALQAAIAAVKRERPGILVELEADTLAQVETFLGLEGVDIILLDNMSLDDLSAAVARGKGRVELEASGGVTLESVAGIAATGVDAISVGALTHSAGSMDFSLELQRG
ncbi:MAG: carboxylating nicotinate-nucleotide diphosphorylase [Verrucomicrobiales bacterium]